MEIDDDMEVKEVVEEVKEAEKKEGDGEDDEDADDAPAEDDNKKKSDFNPEDFEWTTSNKCPKNLAQLFFKKKGKC